MPISHESFAHYTALKNSSRYIPISELIDGCIYLVHARNSYLGIWDGTAKGFVILREKFGQAFLFVEYHWDTGEPFGTVKPFGKLTDPVACENRQKALDEAHTLVSYEHFMEMTRAYLGYCRGPVRGREVG